MRPVCVAALIGMVFLAAVNIALGNWPLVILNVVTLGLLVMIWSQDAERRAHDAEVDRMRRLLRDAEARR